MVTHMDTLYPIELAPSTASISPAQSLTILLRRTIARPDEPAFLETLQTLLKDFSQFPGTAGSKVFRQEKEGTVEFSIVQHFVTETDHAAWLQSPAFVRWQEKIAPLTPDPNHIRRYSGLESLFVTGRKSTDATPRWKMTIILILAVYPMSLALSYWFAPALATMPLFSGTLLTSVVMVLIMTYVMVPILTRLFRRWL